MASLRVEWFCSMTRNTETLGLSETGGKRAKRQQKAPLRVTSPLLHLSSPLQRSHCRILIRPNQVNAALLLLFPHSKQDTEKQPRCTPSTCIPQVRSPAAVLEDSGAPFLPALQSSVPWYLPTALTQAAASPEAPSTAPSPVSLPHMAHEGARLGPSPQPKQSRARTPATLQTKTVLLSSSSCTNPCRCVSLGVIIRFVKEPCYRSKPRGSSSFG